MLQHVFVYGTLKTGQCREKCWPLSPVSIEPAWTLGALYDTGPYPALVHGSDAVAGEIWSFPAVDIASVLAVLDEVEGTNQSGAANEYDREWVTAHLLSGQSLDAQTYLYAQHQQLVNFSRVTPSVQWHEKPIAIWPRGASWPPGAC